MKQKIRIIFIFVLLLLLIVVIVIVIVIVIVNRTRQNLWINLLNQLPQRSIFIFASPTSIIMLGVIWMKLTTIMQRPLINNSGSIVQKYYQKYRKQFLRLCCCSYHVPPGPGPGGGGSSSASCRGCGCADRGNDHYHNKRKNSCRIIRKRNNTLCSSGNSIENDSDNFIGNNANNNMNNIINNVNNSVTNNTSSCSSGSNNSNCRKSNRRRRSLSGGLIWLLIGLVWLEGPLLISCKMNSSGDHMVKINSSTNRVMSTEQQNKKFDILSNSKRFNKIYNKNSSNSNKVGGNNSNNNNNNNSNSGSGNGANSGTGNGATGGRNSNNKNNYKSNNNSNNSKSNENTNNNKNNNTNTKNNNNKFKNNLSPSSRNDGKDNGVNTSPSGHISNNKKEFYNSNINSHNHNNYNDNDNNNDNKFTDNNYYRYSNNYNYLDHYQIEEEPNHQQQQQHQLEEQFYSEHQPRHQNYHYHTPVHLSDSHYEKQLHQHQTQHNKQQHQHQQKNYDQQQHQQQNQPYDNVYIEDTNKRSILASIGCPNCVFNDNYNNYNNKPFISSDTSSLGTFLSSSSSTEHDHQNGESTNLQYADNKAKSMQYQNTNRRPTIINNNLSSDMIRLESIKRQILSKLGMKSKPNVTHPLPKQFIMDTLYRADGGDYVGVNFGFRSTATTTSTQTLNDDMNTGYGDGDYSVNDDYNGSGGNSHMSGSGDGGGNSDSDDLTNFVMYNNPEASTDFVFDVSSTHTDGASIATESDFMSSHSYQSQKNNEETFVDSDDFFGSTKEIITFAEKGKMFNGHRLIEFSSPADQVTGQDLQIRSATIWIRIESRQQILRKRMQARQINETNLTIWIFQLSGDDLRGKEFDELATLSSSLSVRPNQLGWQKLDVTETVRQWYGRGKSEKLRLLIDCTGCGHRYNLHLFQQDTGAGDDNQQHNFNQRHNKQHKLQHSSYNNHQQSLHHHHHNHQISTSYNRRLHRKQRQRSRKDRFQFELEKTVGQRHSSRSSRINSSQQQKDKSRGNYQQQSTKDKRDRQQQNVGDNNHDDDDGINNNNSNVDPNRPFLVIYTDPNRVRRVRRRAVDCSGAINGQCCKESFYVSFKALGWDDWIIAPHGYFANYCRGDCGGPHRTPDTFQSYHTHVMEEFRKMDRLNGMQPCCAPLKFSSMSLIYYGNEGIIKRDLPKMVVDECGCP